MIKTAIKLDRASKRRFDKSIDKLEGYVKTVDKRLSDFAISAADSVRSVAPEDTGNLKDNITYTIKKSEIEVESKAPYSGAVEYGTRQIRPNPFFFPTLRQNKQKLTKDLRKLLKNIIK